MTEVDHFCISFSPFVYIAFLQTEPKPSRRFNANVKDRTVFGNILGMKRDWKVGIFPFGKRTPKVRLSMRFAWCVMCNANSRQSIFPLFTHPFNTNRKQYCQMIIVQSLIKQTASTKRDNKWLFLYPSLSLQYWKLWIFRKDIYHKNQTNSFAAAGLKNKVHNQNIRTLWKKYIYLKPPCHSIYFVLTSNFIVML